MLALWSFTCKVNSHFFLDSLSQHNISCATVGSQEACFQALCHIWFFTESSWVSPPCLPCLSISVFFHSLQKVPPAKVAQAVVPQCSTLLKLSLHSCVAWHDRPGLDWCWLDQPSSGPSLPKFTCNVLESCSALAEPLCYLGMLFRMFCKYQCVVSCHSAWSQQPTRSNPCCVSVWESLSWSAILKPICDHV